MASQPTTNMRLGLVLAGAAAVLWGTVGIAAKLLYGMVETNALSIGFLRLALSLPLLFAAAWWTTGRNLFRIAPRHLVLMALFGFMMALYQLFYFSAITYVGVAIATLLALCTAPVIVAYMAMSLLGEAVSRRTLAALGIVVAGAALLIGFPGSSAIVPGGLWIGVILALAAASAYAGVALAGRALAPHYPPLQSAAIGFAVGALVLLPFAGDSGLVLSYPPAGWALLLYIGVAPTALAYTVFFFALRYTPATPASIVTMVEPLTAMLLAWVIFDERLGAAGLIGAALLLGGVTVLYRGGATSEEADSPPGSG